MKEIETPQATPEQLLKLLDLQLSQQRNHRETSRGNRAVLIVGGVLFIVAVAAAALLVLGQMIEDYRTTGVTTQGTAGDADQR